MHTIVVAGTHSGAGKTSVAVGLIGALRRRGLVVQPFKVGPDFIDPAHHARAAGRQAHNLDGWMLSRESNMELFASHSADADVAVVEGVMGLFDGSDPRAETGSAAEMAKWLDAPIVLVIDASAMARSAAALVHGYATFDPALRVAGVIANRVGSAGHAGLIEAALEGGPPLLGWLEADPAFTVPERHLGLHLPRAADVGTQREALADAVERSIDLDAVLAATRSKNPDAAHPVVRAARRARIGIARDEAFAFYYEDNLALLEQAGAELVEFSPLADPLPDVDGLYIGGGYPELFAAQLEANSATRDAIRRFAAAGHPVYAECGGLMYLAEELHVDGVRHEMCGALPVAADFPGPLELGYCEVTTLGGHVARGHWFHNGRMRGSDDMTYAAGNTIGSWVHVHFRSNPAVAEAIVAAAARRNRG
ncbi:MAG TPA: cobyrinate a,c-diamide synthase [Thermoleophilaceae bacterium]